MENRVLTMKERDALGKKLMKLAKELLGAKNIGNVQKTSIKMEVDEPIEIELKMIF